MLKKRIAATLVVKDGIVVQSIGFKRYLPVGKPAIAIEFLNQWGIDEIIYLDITASRRSQGPDFGLIREASRKCGVPLTVGGGITSVKDIEVLMHCGADKVVFNRAVVNNPGLLSDTAKIFGNQCVVASIDVIKEAGEYRAYDYLTGRAVNIHPVELIQRAENAGAGELLINSVDRDGSYKGYDLDLLKLVTNVATVPVICLGGAGGAPDMCDVFSETSVSAASAANFYHFTEHSVITTKAQLVAKLNVRLDTFADYNDSSFDRYCRLIKKSDNLLEGMLFEKIEKEVI